VDHTPPLEENDLKHIYCSKTMSTKTPTGLQHKTWFDMMYFLCRRGRENLRTMTKDTFKVATDSHGRKYVYQHKDELVLLWAQLTKIYPPLPTSIQPISITKILLIVPTKNERDPPLFTGKLLIKSQNILRNTTQVIIRHRVKIIFSVISNPITLERQKWKSSKKKGILLSSPVSSW
jgi:hypothetical protein